MKPNQLNTTGSTSQVRVCVRARPITAKEQENGSTNILEMTNSNAIQLSGRCFTFDSVFDAATSQQDLYEDLAPSLLKSFLEGYNATIIAYGQTGSGKTYTMGSEAHTELEVLPNTGLIPRFLMDLFEQLTMREFHLEASFLEVYGDDIHDLLDFSRTVLPLREDSGGGIICTGLTVRTIQSAAEAVKILHEGTLNRSTAATLMNVTSSRSHAVFTVTLKLQNVSSKLTFVDLAGSERMKKTGAEGERAREGIQINMGLLALGNVINALADEERLQKGGKKAHVPYRQSKLTRLLQDALGGNSQTVFLACVSSTDVNVSETLSTLQYAYRARNIQNTPTRNVDNTADRELQLKAYISVLEAELVGQIFGGVDRQASPTGRVTNDIMKRPDVVDYFLKLQSLANDCSDISETFPSGVTQYPSTEFLANKTGDANSQPSILDANQSVMDNVDTALLAEVNPDEDIAILDQLLELQQQDHDFDREQKKDYEELKQVEGELVEKEQLLMHLRESLVVYHNMKAKYESLIVEVQNLEREKIELAEQLEKASNNPAFGCSRTIKKEMEIVERSLARARDETQRHRLMYLKAEQEAQKCKTLELKVQELKDGRANLIKKQREAAQRHRDIMESRTKEILALKRKDRNAERKMTKLEAEIKIHKQNLDNRQAYCKKLIEQKKQTETHLMKLLAMRQQNLRERSTRTLMRDNRSVNVSHPASEQGMFATLNGEVKSVGSLLDTAISKAVLNHDLECQYKNRFEAYSDLMRSMASAVKELDNLDKEEQQESMHVIHELDLKIEIAESDLKKIQMQRSHPITVIDDFIESSARRILPNQPASILRTVIIELMKKLAVVEVRAKQLTTSIQLKDNILKSFDVEVDGLNNTIAALKGELMRRHSKLLLGNESEIAKSEELKQENHSLRLALEVSDQENSLLKLFSIDLNQDYESLQLTLNETKEKLAVAESYISQEDKVPPQYYLEKIHEIWREVGLASTDREKHRKEIENCLEFTCCNLMEKAQDQKERTIAEISVIRDDLSRLCTALKLDPHEFNSSAKSLLEQLHELKMFRNELNPIMQRALERRRSIVNKALELANALDIPKESLDENLIELLDMETKSRASHPDIGIGQCSEEFFVRCDEAIAKMRVEKRKILMSNEKLREESQAVVVDMNLKPDEVVALVNQSVLRRFSSLPVWWDDHVLEMVARSVSTIGELVRPTRSLSIHLETVHESLLRIADVRRQLSNKIRSIIERAQKTLLTTVDSEFEANSEYSKLHDELFRLPPLSADFIHSCFAEIEALSTGVDVMSQSEIETLTVVSEALGISSTNRGMFWDVFDRSIRESTSVDTKPFDQLMRMADAVGEEWLVVSLKGFTKSYVELDSRLLKLEKIHEEVELLRNRQDTKSRIISLDTEVRILSVQLKEFEDKKCNKQRLTTKKTTSSTLLREERFRKHMQSKFTAKLTELISMLEAWKSTDNSNTDRDLLSEEVRSILRNSGRSEFMHLRTVEYNRTLKRTADVLGPPPVAHSPPPTKRGKISKRGMVAQSSNVVLRTRSDDSTCEQGQILAPIRGDVQNVAQSNQNVAKTDSVNRPNRKKKIVLDPFGNVLALATSPHPPASKENV